MDTSRRWGGADAQTDKHGGKVRKNNVDMTPEITSKYLPQLPRFLTEKLPAGKKDSSGCIRKQHDHVTVYLLDADLWNRFRQVGTEMIITKKGRRVFPIPTYVICDLDKDKLYNVYIELKSVDNAVHKYLNGEWVVSKEGSNHYPTPVPGRDKYLHPLSPNSGARWMLEPISFSGLKISNNMEALGTIVLQSMRRYQMTLTVTELGGAMTVSIPQPETQFVAVTQYQNEKVTQMKIEHNPFANGFRFAISKKEMAKRNNSQSQEEDSEENVSPVNLRSSPVGLSPSGPVPIGQYPTGHCLSAPSPNGSPKPKAVKPSVKHSTHTNTRRAIAHDGQHTSPGVLQHTPGGPPYSRDQGVGWSNPYGAFYTPYTGYPLGYMYSPLAGNPLAQVRHLGQMNGSDEPGSPLSLVKVKKEVDETGSGLCGDRINNLSGDTNERLTKGESNRIGDTTWSGEARFSYSYDTSSNISSDIRVNGITCSRISSDTNKRNTNETMSRVSGDTRVSCVTTKLASDITTTKTWTGEYPKYHQSSHQLCHQWVAPVSNDQSPPASSEQSPSVTSNQSPPIPTIRSPSVSPEDHQEFPTDLRHKPWRSHQPINNRHDLPPVRPEVTLKNGDIWATTHEVVVTTDGRPMFPYIALSVTKLDATRTYDVSLELTPASQWLYDYLDDEWTPCQAAPADPRLTPYQHPDSPRGGQEWGSEITFDRLRLSTSRQGKNLLKVELRRQYCPVVTLRTGESVWKYPLRDAIFITVSIDRTPMFQFLYESTSSNKESIKRSSNDAQLRSSHRKQTNPKKMRTELSNDVTRSPHSASRPATRSPPRVVGSKPPESDDTTLGECCVPSEPHPPADEGCVDLSHKTPSDVDYHLTSPCNIVTSLASPCNPVTSLTSPYNTITSPVIKDCISDEALTDFNPAIVITQSMDSSLSQPRTRLPLSYRDFNFRNVTDMCCKSREDNSARHKIDNSTLQGADNSIQSTDDNNLIHTTGDLSDEKPLIKHTMRYLDSYWYDTNLHPEKNEFHPPINDLHSRSNDLHPNHDDLHRQPEDEHN
ncbi:uncharacterized protein LOC131947812 [Physella acuta]|uniref:uncharacterized protein LOC131947812 n=1 Tax=Physella acuta TaxID=109671 RepID=UPI0027DD4316|nr:uncharacterized protein LOC131947812 [Physella acuta]XP_059165132.1 uncharacterized protein LOC131947812 [Physella acuta]